jgi:hypothetical protein
LEGIRAELPETGSRMAQRRRQGSQTANGRKRTHNVRADLDGENAVQR